MEVSVCNSTVKKLARRTGCVTVLFLVIFEMVLGSFAPVFASTFAEAKVDKQEIEIPNLPLPFNGEYEVSRQFGELIQSTSEEPGLTSEVLAKLAEIEGEAGHTGIDFAMPEGTQVSAVDEGEVEKAGDGDYGVTIVIKHSWGESIYGHLSKVISYKLQVTNGGEERKLQEGDKVLKGQVIGLSGSSGIVTGPHLHLGIKDNDGEWVDPVVYLSLNDERKTTNANQILGEATSSAALDVSPSPSGVTFEDVSGDDSYLYNYKFNLANGTSAHFGHKYDPRPGYAIADSEYNYKLRFFLDTNSSESISPNASEYSSSEQEASWEVSLETNNNSSGKFSPPTGSSNNNNNLTIEQFDNLPIVDGNRVEFPITVGGVDATLRYTVESDRVKEEIILSEKPNDEQLTINDLQIQFEVQKVGLEVESGSFPQGSNNNLSSSSESREASTEGEYTFRSTDGSTDSAGPSTLSSGPKGSPQAYWKVLKPSVLDANGKSGEIEGKLIVDDSNYELTLASTFLEQATYPVTIDPTVITNNPEDFLMTTGSYRGSGAARSITGLGFQPIVVIVKGDTVEYAVWRSNSMTGDSTAYFSPNVANFSGGITSLDSDGFTAGTDASVNSSGLLYYYIAFGDGGAGDIKTGSYTGNATDNRSITGVGFQPDLVWVKRDGSNVAIWRSTALTGDLSSFFGSAAEATNYIQAFESDGFQIGTNSVVNTNGSTYHYVAFKNVSSQLATGSYTGNGTDNRSITGVGFQPELVWVKISSATSNLRFKPDSLTGDNTFQVGASTPTANRIQALESDGFQIGSAAEVNTSGSTYRYVAFNDINQTPNAPNVAQAMVWNVRGDANTWDTTFGSYVRDGDFVQIVNGNCGSTLNTTTAIDSYNTASSYLAGLGRQNLTFGIYTSDYDNVQSVTTATANVSGITYIGYGYEPGCGDEFPDDVGSYDSTGWVFATALSNVTTAKNNASSGGKKLMVVPTGRPLLEKGLATRDWDYAKFISQSGADYMLVQTQTWVSQGIFKNALDELLYELNKNSVSQTLVFPQVTVDPDANPNVNGVDVTTAYNAVLTAQNRGFNKMSLWYDTGDTASATSFLDQVAILNSSRVLGPTSQVDESYITDNTPTLQFYLSDPDTSNTIKFRIQIDDNPDFSSPAVNYTSGLNSQGSVSFTVGQNAGSGSYSNGQADQTLTDGQYYWRVRAQDNNGENSAFTAANKGNVGFRVDTTAPNIIDLDSPANNAQINSSRPIFRWKAASTGDAGSGLSKYRLEVSFDNGQGFRVENIPVSQSPSFETGKYKATYENFSDSDNSNNYISLQTKFSTEWGSKENYGKVKNGKVTWKVIGIDSVGNERSSETRTFYVGSSLQTVPTQFEEINVFQKEPETGVEEKKELTFEKAKIPKLGLQKLSESLIRRIAEVLVGVTYRTSDVLSDSLEYVSSGIASIFGKTSERGREFAYGLSGLIRGSAKGAEILINKVERATEGANNLAHRVYVGSVLFAQSVFSKDPTTISDVAIAHVSPNEVIISWRTNHYATSKVNYGFGTSYGRSMQLTNYTKEHTLRLVGLEPGKKYYFEVMSQGVNYVYDAYYTFTTLGD